MTHRPRHSNPEIADLIPRYLVGLWEDLARIEDSVASGGFEEIARIGHRMAGSGAVYGFTQISEIGRALERAGTTGARGEATEHVEKLRSYLTSMVIRPAEPSD